MAYRAEKSGFAREAQQKVDEKYDADEAAKALKWIVLLKPQATIPDVVNDAVSKIDQSATSYSMDDLHDVLKDGLVLGYLMACLKGGSVNLNTKTWKVSAIAAFEQAHQRERIGMFLSFVVEYGVSSAHTFQTDQLYERTNLAQVVICIANLGTEAQSRPEYTGPAGFWLAKHKENKRDFTDEQLRSGDTVIGLQMGSNKGATAAGVTMGAQRHITDTH